MFWSWVDTIRIEAAESRIAALIADAGRPGPDMEAGFAGLQFIYILGTLGVRTGVSNASGGRGGKPETG
ncbi:hypothetical protein ES703_67998 [subsurface metagenome]